MPAAVVFSPIFLDQRFPREIEELRVVQAGLAFVARGLRAERFRLIFSEALEEFLDQTNTTWRDSHAINGALVDINRLLCELIWRAEGVIRLRLPVQLMCAPHPTPANCDGELVDHWAAEAGRLLSVHDGVCPGSEYFIGVICPYRCCGRDDSGAYSGALPPRYFPLVGADPGSRLADAYAYQVPKTVHDRRITVGDIIKNFKAIGGSEIENVKGTDHLRIVFPGRPGWQFDSGGGRGKTPISDKACRELETLTGYPAQAIKASLIDGTPIRGRVYFRLFQYVWDYKPR